MEETKVHEIRVKKETARMEPLETLSRPDAQPTKAHPKPSPAPVATRERRHTDKHEHAYKDRFQKQTDSIKGK
jgi:hypothetical protein